jgi:hypothetical protein
MRYGWSASRLGRFDPEERAPGIHIVGSCIDFNVCQKEALLLLPGIQSRVHVLTVIKTKGKGKTSRNKPEGPEGGGGRGIALLFLDLGTRSGCWSAPRPGRFLPPERSGTNCTGGWVGPRAGLYVYEKSRLHWDSIPGSSSP